MDFKEVIPITALRKFDAMCLHNEYLHLNKEMQQQILSWAADMLKEAKAEWSERRNDTIESIIECHMRSEAKRKSDIKDQKYAPFREYFKNLQQRRFNEYQKAGQRLSANRFVEWFLENTAENIEIPYRQSNLKNKLIQLAQANNREFKKLLLG